MNDDEYDTEEQAYWDYRPRIKFSSSISLDGGLLSPIKETSNREQFDPKKHKKKKLHRSKSFDNEIEQFDLKKRKKKKLHRSKSFDKKISISDLLASDDLPRHNHHRPHRSKSLDSEVSIFDTFIGLNDYDSSDRNSRIGATADTNNNGHYDDDQDQIRGLDEAFRLYYYAERSALRIQQAFRERQKEKELSKEDDSDVATEKQSDVDEEVGEKDSDDSSEYEDKSDIYTMIFLALFYVCTVLPSLLMKAFNCFKRFCGGDDTGGADAVANATMPQGGAGGGGTPSGGEAGAAGGAQGAMAAQAASSAASGAASGVAAGAAAGAAASSAAAAATAGATAAAAGATQVATIVAVSTAAVAATVATTVAVANTPAPEPILSTCGLANPDIRSGRMVMLFEGIPRPFDERESSLVENLVMQSYNELTLGTNVAVTGCLDPLAREMQNISIVNQTLSLGTKVLDPNKLEVVFEAQVSCDRCSDTSPLFSEDQVEGQDDTSESSTDTATVGNSPDSSGDNTTDFATVATATTEGVVLVDDEQSRHLLSIDFSSQKFFQKLIQLVIFETEELADEGELPEGFVQISKALVITSDEKEEETLVTEVKYKRQASSSNGGSGGGGSGGGSGGLREDFMATFEFGYVDESGEVQKDTVVVTEEGEAVPTTAFPTFQPTHTPTTTPSSMPTAFPSFEPSHTPTTTPSSLPTNVFSGQPTQIPSSEPSSVPSSFPSQSPSGVPSVEPSLSPSDSPSVIPSVSPSDLPSVIPSESPSEQPSSSPSMFPSMVPSTLPSMVPSTFPSFVPSMVPSFVPSETPSDQPSSEPSASPSRRPTVSPSDQPTGSILLTLPGTPVTQSSTFISFASADKAIDGNRDGNYYAESVTSTDMQDNPWWEANIYASWLRPCIVRHVTICNRSDCCSEWLYGAFIQLLDGSGVVRQQIQIPDYIQWGCLTFAFNSDPYVYYLRVSQPGTSKILYIAEIEAYGFCP